MSALWTCYQTGSHLSHRSTYTQLYPSLSPGIIIPILLRDSFIAKNKTSVHICCKPVLYRNDELNKDVFGKGVTRLILLTTDWLLYNVKFPDTFPDSSQHSHVTQIKHVFLSVLPHTHTHMHPFNVKVKPIWILLKQETVSSSGISWAICKSATRSRQITTPAPFPQFLQAGCPSRRPANSVKSTEGESVVPSVKM